MGNGLSLFNEGGVLRTSWFGSPFPMVEELGTVRVSGI